MRWQFPLLTLTLLSIVATSAAADDRPNVLFIVSEDNGPALGCYGEPSVRTPVLDTFAAEGVRFERAFVAQAGCSQSRASLLTGLYPHQHGQIGLATWKFRMYRDDTPNVVRSLHEAGYRTGLIGKLHVNPESAFPFDFHEIANGNFVRREMGCYAQAAGKFFAAGEEPFFLSVNYPDAHRPFLRQIEGLPADPHDAQDVRPLAYMGVDHPSLQALTADYYNCMERLDTLVGHLLAELERSGKAGNTLVVYLGDHGADMLRGKRTSHEGGVRIPLIVRWPRRASAGQVRRELVSTVDLFPTILEAAGVQPPPDLPGRSLVPLLRGEPPRWREFLFTEFHTHSAHEFYPQRTVRNDRFKLIHNLLASQPNPGLDHTLRRVLSIEPEVLQSGSAEVQAAYERMRQPPEFELYDLASDPYEWRNLADDPRHAGTLHELQFQLARWRDETRDPLLNHDHLLRLKREIDDCFVDGEPDKERLRLSYTEYFFTAARPRRLWHAAMCFTGLPLREAPPRHAFHP